MTFPQTSNDMLAMIQNQEIFDQFLQEYRATRKQNLPKDIPSWLIDKYDAYIHLAPSEIRAVVEFAAKYGFCWHPTGLCFSTDRFATKDVRSALHDTAARQVAIIPTDNGQTNIHLWREDDVSDTFLRDRFLSLEHGYYKTVVPEDHWNWMCEQKIYDPNICHLHRLLHDMALLVRAHADFIERVRLDGTVIFRALRFDRLKKELSKYDGLLVRAEIGRIQSYFELPEYEKRWLSEIRASPDSIDNDPAADLSAICAAIERLKQGRMQQNLEPETSLLQQFVQYLQTPTPKPFFRSIHEMLSLRELPCMIYFLLQSPLRDRVLDCFPQEQHEEMIRCLNSMFSWLEKELPVLMKKHHKHMA